MYKEAPEPMQTFIRFLQDETGATAIEYGLIAAIIAVALISGLGAFGDGLVKIFEQLRTSMANAGKE